MLKKSKFELGLSLSFMVKVVVLEKPLGMRQMLKLNGLVEMSHQSKNMFKIQIKNPICGEKKQFWVLNNF